MTDVHSSHIGNIFTTRHMAGSCHVPWATRFPVTLLAPHQMLCTARASSRLHMKTCSVHISHRNKGLGLCPSAELGSSKLPSMCLHLRLHADNLNSRTGSDTCVTHGLDKSWGPFWKYYPCSSGTSAWNSPSRVQFTSFPLIGGVDASKQFLLISWDCCLPWAFLCLSKSHTIWLRGGDTTPQREMFADMSDHCQGRWEKGLVSLVLSNYLFLWFFFLAHTIFVGTTKMV